MLGRLRQLAATHDCRGATDADLLRRFAAQADDAAFTEIVRRYAPMVYGVCRRLLRHQGDADDAFQASCIVLARRAASIAKPELLGNWLYGVAYRTALRAKVDRARRSRKRVGMAEPSALPPAPEVELVEVQAVLDEEIARLPERVRLPFILCHVQGMTNAAAARRIGVPKGTVLSRLAQARERLRLRLARRGIAPTFACLVPEAVRPAVAEAAVRVALRPEMAPPSVLALAKGVTPMEFVASKKVATLLAAALLGSGMVAYQAGQTGPDASNDAAPITQPAQAPREPSAGLWSDTRNGLKARLLATRKVDGAAPVLHLTLEVMNVSAKPLALLDDPLQVKVDVLDAEGKPVPPAVTAVDILTRLREWGVIPSDAYLGFPLGIDGIGRPEGTFALLAAGDSAWQLRGGRYTVRGKLTALAEVKRKGVRPENAWSGEFDLPPVAIQVEKDWLRPTGPSVKPEVKGSQAP